MHCAMFYNAVVLVPFDVGVVYITICAASGSARVLVPFDVGVVYILESESVKPQFIVLVPFDVGVVYIILD